MILVRISASDLRRGPSQFWNFSSFISFPSKALKTWFLQVTIVFLVVVAGSSVCLSHYILPRSREFPVVLV